MSFVHDARVSIFFAEYIGFDNQNRIHVMGGGLTWLIVNENGMTQRLSTAAVIEFPASAAGTDVPIMMELRDETEGKVVTAQMPNGQEEAIRLQQLVPLQKGPVQGVSLPSDMPVEHRVLLDFANGMLLKPNRHYIWRLEIDSQHLKGWEAHFWTVSNQPTVIFGGRPDPDPDPTLPRF